MLDTYNRPINYLRISLTDRCNLRCTYCMPARGRAFMPKEKLLSDEEILECVRITSKHGIGKIRLTGGEPLLRENLVFLIQNIAQCKGIEDIAITTNGILLKNFAPKLAEAGLKRVNISLDTIDSTEYSQITRGGNIKDVFEGIEAARKCGLEPIKINCVIHHSDKEPAAQGVAEFCKKENIKIRFIRQMNLETGIFHKVEGGEGGNCALCNRMRLTANGYFKPCLFDGRCFDIRKLGIENAFLMAIDKKPEKGTKDTINKFYNIGG